MNNNTILLKEYKDKVYIYNILTSQTNDYYSHIKSIINIPLIVSSSVMTILNSGSFDPEDMKVPNIVINACTALLISLINNFKIVERQQTFRALSLKYNTLLHHIEDKLNNDDNIDAEDTRAIIKEYDELISMNEYIIPHHIQQRVKKTYLGKKYLPTILNGDSVSPSVSPPDTTVVL